MTYLPRHFEETNPATLHALVRDYPLATWVVQSEGELLVNHIPFLLDSTRGEHGTLIGHVARSNPVWRILQAGRVSVAIFTGANTYISPNWYPTKKENGKAVPTWNYAIVHAHGVAQGLRQQGSDAARKMADWVMPEPPAASGSCESAVSRLTR